MIVSQKSTPGSALFHALWIIFFQSADASPSFLYFGSKASIGYWCSYFSPLIAAFINASSILTDTFAPVILPSVILASINASASGCFMLTDNIRAPLLPSCATSLVEFEYLSINGTNPVEVKAEFFTGEPLGRICERS